MSSLLIISSLLAYITVHYKHWNWSCESFIGFPQKKAKMKDNVDWKVLEFLLLAWNFNIIKHK